MDKNEPYIPLWNFKIMLLRAIHKTSLLGLGEFRISIFKTLLGDLDKILLEFINTELLKKPTFTDCIDSSMTVKQLKDFLKSKGVKVAGKKIDMILRASDLFSTNEKIKIQESGNIYILTTTGWEIFRRDNERFQKELKEFENYVVGELLKGEFDKAFKSVSDFFASYPFPIGMGTDWSKGLNETFREVVYHIMKSDYLTQQMNISDELKKEILAIVSANYLFQFAGFSKGNISEKILLVFPEFKCEQIEFFLENNPTGIFRSFDSQKQEEVVEIFNHSVVSHSYNQVMLKEILRNRENRRYKGVEIIEGKNSFCIHCFNKQLKYEWENLKSLPILPLFPGCVCSYVHMFASD